MKNEIVNIVQGDLPADYHCSCQYCSRYLGLLIRSNGVKYSKLERNQYYDEKSGATKGGHIAKTPLHIARWAVQNFTKPKDWVMDPTMGAGTTAVEALNEGRNTAGIEIEFIDVIERNVAANNPFGLTPQIHEGDARNIGALFKGFKPRFNLIVNNPPYSGDKRERKIGTMKKNGYTYDEKNAAYDSSKPNLAFLGENEEYYKTIADIYNQCLAISKPRAHLVIGVKDMIREKKPYLLHKLLAEAIEKHCPSVKYVGMALLPHYPPTLFMSTYCKRYPDLNIKVPRYQTIIVFKKG